MLSLYALGDWKRYKRYCDNVILYGRLVEMGGKKYIQIREKKGAGGQLVCPHCQTILSEASRQLPQDSLPDAFLSPEIFHQRHTPKPEPSS